MRPPSPFTPPSTEAKPWAKIPSAGPRVLAGLCIQLLDPTYLNTTAGTCEFVGTSTLADWRNYFNDLHN